MKLLQRIWDDVRSGENIDQYLTIVAAIALTILNLAGVSLQSQLAPFTLAVLALLAINGLGNRFKMEELLNAKTESLDSFFTDEFPPSYKTDFENSDVMWLVGVSLHRTIKTNYTVLEKNYGKVKRFESCSFTHTVQELNYPLQEIMLIVGLSQKATTFYLFLSCYQN
jgi:hypothetical protein